MCVCVETVYSRGAIRNLTLQPWHQSSTRSGSGQGMRPKTAVATTPGQSGQFGRSGQDLPCNPEDPVLGTDMTQGEWDQLRSLLRKAEDGGKMNELMSVHRKEVKNAP